jgi:hypothetical protein
MKIKTHYQDIIEALEGKAEPLRAVAAARRDWTGPGMILELYEKTSGQDRATFIDAIGQIIEDHSASPAAVAELIYVAASLDLAQVEPKVRKLLGESFGAQEPVRKAIGNFLALRTMAAAGVEAVSSMLRANGSTSKPKDRNAIKAKNRVTTKKSPAVHRKATDR